LAAPLAAQDPVIRIDVSLVNITFTVRNKQGGLVGNLNQEDFQVFEDGKPQTINRFQRDNDLPLTIGMLIDVSGSMYNILETGKRAASQFFRKVLRPKDLAFLISFGSETELLQDLTSSPEYLDRGLEQVRGQRPTRVMTQGPVPTRQRGTLLYDAVYLAAQEKLRSESGRKVIVIISDGADMGSYYKLADALKQSHLSDAVIYSFFYYEPMFGSDEGALKRMSTDTGGCVFDAYKRGALEQAFQQLEEEMRSQYALSYAPTNTASDGSFRRVEIKTKDGGLRVQARRGYYAPGA
jgi:VWFA-related protein